MSEKDILPSSRPQQVRGITRGTFMGNQRLNWTPIFCANCGTDGGMVPEENRDFAFYLCEPCAEKWGNVAGTLMVPDAIFWEKVRQHQIEKYARLLTPQEIEALLQDGQSDLSTLAKDRPRFGIT